MKARILKIDAQDGDFCRVIVRQEEGSYLRLWLQHGIASCCVSCICWGVIKVSLSAGNALLAAAQKVYHDLQAALVTTEMDRVNC